MKTPPGVVAGESGAIGPAGLRADVVGAVGIRAARRGLVGTTARAPTLVLEPTSTFRLSGSRATKSQLAGRAGDGARTSGDGGAVLVRDAMQILRRGEVRI